MRTKEIEHTACLDPLELLRAWWSWAHRSFHPMRLDTIYDKISYLRLIGETSDQSAAQLVDPIADVPENQTLELRIALPSGSIFAASAS